jgi:hypothetical protein
MTTYVVTVNGEEYATIEAENINDAAEETVLILKSDYEYLEGMLRGRYGDLTPDEPLIFDPEGEAAVQDDIFIESIVDEEDSVRFECDSAECIIKQLLEHGEILIETGDELSGEIVVQITRPVICWDHPVFVIEKQGASRIAYHPVPGNVEKTERTQTLFFSRRDVEYFGLLRPAEGGALLTILNAVKKVEMERMHEVYDYDN